MSTVSEELNNIISKQNLFSGDPIKIPALVENQTQIFETIRRLAETYIESAKALSFAKIHAMFLFATCRGYEAAYHFHNNTDYQINPNDLFAESTECNISETLLKKVFPVELHTNMFNGFQNWSLINITYCKDNNIDPLDPLLEALEITYTTAINIAIQHLPANPNKK